jgi:predicted enzyme related to lactoylglutathione lyase
VIVSVSDLDRALRFYAGVLGLVPDPGPPGLARTSVPGGAELLLHERATPSRMGVAAAFAVDDVDAATAAAEAAGCVVLVEPADQPWDERQSVLTDPDGHVVCLVARQRRRRRRGCMRSHTAAVAKP